MDIFSLRQVQVALFLLLEARNETRDLPQLSLHVPVSYARNLLKPKIIANNLQYCLGEERF